MQEKLFHAYDSVDMQDSYATLEDFEHVLKASSVDALGREVRRVTRHLGFDHFLYGVRYAPPEGEACQFILSGYPQSWMEHYLEVGYVDVDPIVAHAYQHATPLIWGDTVFDTPQRKILMEEARAAGLGSGVSVPTGSLANEMAVASVANAETNRDALVHTVHAVGTLYVLSSFIHEAIHRLVLAPPSEGYAPQSLTPRELECLRWWAGGKSAPQISDIMAISEDTVHFHMKNIKRKLGVRSKHQAIARAILMGLVMP